MIYMRNGCKRSSCLQGENSIMGNNFLQTHYPPSLILPLLLLDVLQSINFIHCGVLMVSLSLRENKILYPWKKYSSEILYLAIRTNNIVKSF